MHGSRAAIFFLLRQAAVSKEPVRTQPALLPAALYTRAAGATGRAPKHSAGEAGLKSFWQEDQFEFFSFEKAGVVAVRTMFQSHTRTGR